MLTVLQNLSCVRLLKWYLIHSYVRRNNILHVPILWNMEIAEIRHEPKQAAYTERFCLKIV